MNIILSQVLNDDLLRSMGISTNEIIDTTVSPQYSENYELEDIKLFFNLKKYEDYGILTLNEIEGEKNVVHLALKIKLEFMSINDNNPLILLQQIINRNGLSFRIGEQFNKFIFREKINIMPNDVTTLVEIFNPNDHSFIQMFLLKPDSDNMTVDCALAFCLDVDDYINMLFLTNAQDIIEISPSLKKSITHRDLIASSGTFTGFINKSQLGPGTQRKFFHVKYDDYFFEAGLHENSMYIIRNGLELNYDFYWNSDSKGYINFFLTWQPNEIRISLLDLTDEVIDEEELNYIETHSKFLKTVTVFPPNGLIKWSRDQDLIPKSTYTSMEDFYNQVLLALQSINDKVQSVDMVNAFWDNQYKDSKIVSRRPKKEPDVQDTIQGLLFDIAALKNIEIIPQYPIAGGLLDFLVLGQINGIGTKCICVEFKHAHSDDLVHGLVKQLPDYMKAKGTDFGIYCVFFFKGLHFDKPKKYADEEELLLDLHTKNSDSGLHNIRSIIIDLSIKLPPSKA